MHCMQKSLKQTRVIYFLYGALGQTTTIAHKKAVKCLICMFNTPHCYNITHHNSLSWAEIMLIDVLLMHPILPRLQWRWKDGECRAWSETLQENSILNLIVNKFISYTSSHRARNPFTAISIQPGWRCNMQCVSDECTLHGAQYIKLP